MTAIESNGLRMSNGTAGGMPDNAAMSRQAKARSPNVDRSDHRRGTCGVFRSGDMNDQGARGGIHGERKGNERPGGRAGGDAAVQSEARAVARADEFAVH